MSDIFISYSRYDSDVVNELVTLLEQEGYSVWIDRDGIESGDDFKRVILKAIKESKVVLFFSSEHSNVSDWTAKEIGVAVKYKKHIIPVMLDDSNFNEAVEFDLINLDYVDYSKNLTRLAMRERLFKTLRNKLGMGSKESERLEADSKWKATNSYNGHEYVDLGLPSGTFWATCNVGANKPEDYGDYLSWDEGKTVAANWGNGWRMPTGEQWKELQQNTKSTWTTRNGVNGRLFTANNGNSLFLPASGYRYEGSLNDAGGLGLYWSSSLHSGSPYSARYFYFGSGGYFGMLYNYRFRSHSVRAVRSAR